MLGRILTKSKLGLLGAIALLGGACTLSASPVFSCSAPTVSDCDGNLYAIWVVSQTATSYDLEVQIKVTNSYTGSTTDSINALAIIPDNNGSFTNASLIAHPPGTWTLMNGGLNDSGCDGTGTPFICAQATGNGAPLFVSGVAQTLSWEFLITGTLPVSGDTTELKYHYVDTNGAKVGSLGSFAVGIQCIDASCGGGGGGQAVPEPLSFLLAGTGLIGMYFIGRRRAISRRPR